MATNTAPPFARLAQNEWDSAGLLTTANTAKDGTGTVQTIFTSAATDGSFLERIIARAVGTNTASVLRIFVNNGSTNTSAANNKLIAEVSLPATTLTEVAAQPDVALLMNLRMAAGYKINVTIGTTVAAGWHVSGHGASYTA